VIKNMLILVRARKIRCIITIIYNSVSPNHQRCVYQDSGEPSEHTSRNIMTSAAIWVSLYICIFKHDCCWGGRFSVCFLNTSFLVLKYVICMCKNTMVHVCWYCLASSRVLIKIGEDKTTINCFLCKTTSAKRTAVDDSVRFVWRLEIGTQLGSFYHWKIFVLMAGVWFI